MSALTVGCLFSGMGGFASGFEQSGFRIAWASDNDSSACSTFEHRFPDVVPIRKDVRELSVDGDQLEPVDVLIGGFPCQSFSAAGNKKGFGDDRGECFFEIRRLLQEFSASSKPALVVLENVPTVLTGGDPAWFEIIQKELRRSGYWFRRESCWRTNVKDVAGIPQDRERVFLVAASREHFQANPFTPPPPQ